MENQRLYSVVTFIIKFVFSSNHSRIRSWDHPGLSYALGIKFFFCLRKQRMTTDGIRTRTLTSDPVITSPMP